ncbi:LacI family transcriptional regulator [Arthrobacter sp. MYb227]|uniref:LacI family DNA-binding transcriptional regulator n=1 Tax=Arthrobacter sp. MYb227 TaxID=1848601 RepID=UPI000CFB1C02|nr:LacI family DNA-binding transcriptional regulator [Arthrobacter sp. MYb227]PQZ94712.1 LacI family transcriptional regulator [Arthrobacter sp. MYb227]
MCTLAAGTRGPATSIDVAKLAGVSQSAVSRTYTKGASVGAETRARVEAAAAKLGYRPNLIARSLMTRRTNIIGLAVGGLANPFYAAIVEQLSNALQEIGYHVLLFTLTDETDSDELLQQVINLRLDALIMASVSLSSSLASSCQSNGIPVILVNRTTSADGCSSVSTDNEAGATMLAQYVIDAGHSRILYVAGTETTSTNLERERGLTSAIAARDGVAFQRIAGDYDFKTSAQEIAQLLSGSNFVPDAIFCANDFMAFAVMDALRFHHGLRVPQDISVVGFDDSGPASWLSYDLTTYSQPIPQMVEAVISILQAVAQNPDAAPQHVVISGELIIRGSCRGRGDG